ncbi:hypothetical protein GCK32_009493 [Trichostrongylus colubriformis]|uniref:SXP/RAL-2 family protein Ani s 5-like cation-binding domain-containing protein n=1 Tax=Trichostrongylus colubriformis TaxID=6319 RepID=A0AAN8GB31_TRICO
MRTALIVFLSAAILGYSDGRGHGQVVQRGPPAGPPQHGPQTLQWGPPGYSQLGPQTLQWSPPEPPQHEPQILQWGPPEPSQHGPQVVQRGPSAGPPQHGPQVVQWGPPAGPPQHGPHGYHGPPPPGHHGHHGQHGPPPPPYLKNLRGSAKREHAMIMFDKNLTLAEKEEKLMKWAIDNNIKDQVKDFEEKRKSHMEQVKANVSKLIDELPEAFRELSGVLEDQN